MNNGTKDSLKGMKQKYRKGPDQMATAKKYWTSDPEEPVKLRITKNSPASNIPISLPTLLSRVAKKYPTTAALCFKNEHNNYETITFKRYREIVHHFAKVFIKLGLIPRHSVSIIAHNCPQYLIGVLATIHAGGIASGIYTTSSSEALLNMLNDSRANILIVADDDQLEKALSIRHQAKYLKSIVQIFPTTKTSEYKSKVDEYYTWKELEKQDITQQQAELNERLSNISVNECCILVFTSGTTGDSKGVMLSHDNVTWNASAMIERLPLISPGNESFLVFLPLCHIPGIMESIVIALTIAMTVHFADKNAMKGDFIKTLQYVQPTRLTSVPRVLEKMCECINENENYLNPLDFKRMVGFSNLKSIICGGAPLALKTKNYLIRNNVPLIEGYGLSETSGVSTLSTSGCSNYKSVGKTLNGTEIKIGRSDLDVQDHGEIMLRGRNIFMGYIRMESATKEAFTEDGWFHTGDVGHVDKEGFVYITGRLKELIITAGGSKVSPLPIENQLKTELSIISNVCLVGDKQKYVTALLTIKTETDSQTGEPSDTLNPEVRAWMKNLGLNYTKVSEVIMAGPDPLVVEQISAAIDRVNAKAATHIHTIKKFILLPQDFSIATGELSSTLKLKRNTVKEKYEKLITKMYEFQ